MHKGSPTKQTSKTTLAQRLEQVENELFKIDRTILPLRRQNDLALNLTEFPEVMNVHKHDAIKSKTYGREFQPTHNNYDKVTNNRNHATIDVKSKKTMKNAEIYPPTTDMLHIDFPPTRESTASLNNGHQLLILSYMRSGSSMNGNVFKDTGNDFYVYEPLIKFAPYHYFTESRFCQMRNPNCS